ncbi:ABC transporter ATP-binding protein [Novosphingobium piscinae]|uniref:ABC transporter ATP-binding protein n=1 Tax=Novosphingobium piscinae TaxID=1507448 RepID=A0A7X1FZC2_9SPHN|nr:ABC transporter ATP-binding protein [Novosphingobium piscinae]MBC2669768.1 ABC transporter ATP-binding protein [Novosphingobium piscinae]
MIEVSGLTRRRGPNLVVDGLSFSVSHGEIVGLIGVNGAGKTSALECLAGLARADGGEVRIAGLAPGSTAARAITGTLLQHPGLPGRLCVAETLDLFARLHGIRPSPHLVEALGLDALARQRVDALSGGQRQRLALAIALQPAPAVLLLDEPATALDPAMRRDLRGLIEEARTGGAAILMATHDLAEATSLCDRVLLLSAGRLVAAGRPADLIAAAGAPSRITLTTARPLPGERDDTMVIETRDVIAALTALLPRLAGVPVVALHVTGAGLAEVVLAAAELDGTRCT